VPIRYGEPIVQSPDEPEPDQPGCILKVGQDRVGHWLVQENNGKLEGRFISFAAAMAFARSERHSLPGAVIALADAPLVPVVPFAPVEPWESAPHHRDAA